MFWLQSGKQYCEPGKRRTVCGSLGSDQPAFFCGGRDLRCENAENEGSQLHSCACRDDRERDFTVLLAGHAGDRSAECVLKR